jgi:hypothetical protein
MWVSTSMWGYPIFLTLHTIGMGTLVGIALVLNLRFCGFCPDIPAKNIYVYWKIALIGFVINLISGTALFFGSATTLWESRPFRLKIILIASALVLTNYIVKSAMKVHIKRQHQIMAFAAILIWVSALISGRLIAYID